MITEFGVTLFKESQSYSTERTCCFLQVPQENFKNTTGNGGQDQKMACFQLTKISPYVVVQYSLVTENQGIQESPSLSVDCCKVESSSTYSVYRYFKNKGSS